MADNRTVGELIEELGEEAAINHIVAYNIKLRMAAADIADELDTMADSLNERWPADVAKRLRQAMEGS